MDSKIRRITGLYKSVKAGLEWELPPTMIISRPFSDSKQSYCLPLGFMGVRVNCEKDLELGFGDHLETDGRIKNPSMSMSIPCIAL